MNQPTRIAVAVVQSVGHALVGTRPAGVPLAGKAEFPGGKCMDDETSRSCAVRECREETGLIVVPREHLLLTRHEYPHGTVDLDFWRCVLSPDVPDLAPPRAPFRWVALSALNNLDFPSGNRAVLLKLTEELTAVGQVHPHLEGTLLNLQNAFREAVRPEHFTNHTHCVDCAAYDVELQAIADGAVTLAHVGNPVMDPVAHATSAGFRFLLPMLARLALAYPQKFFYRFISHLDAEQVRHLTETEYRALLEFLTNIRAEARRQGKAKSGTLFDATADIESTTCPVFRTDQKLAELRAVAR